MISRLIRILQSPHECGHAMMLANGFPGMPLPMVKIAAYICGFTVFQIQPSTLVLGEKYTIEHFKLDIVNAYTTAGLKVCVMTNTVPVLDHDCLVISCDPKSEHFDKLHYFIMQQIMKKSL